MNIESSLFCKIMILKGVGGESLHSVEIQYYLCFFFIAGKHQIFNSCFESAAVVR